MSATASNTPTASAASPTRRAQEPGRVACARAPGPRRRIDFPAYRIRRKTNFAGACPSMIRKSGYRFSDQIMLKTKGARRLLGSRLMRYGSGQVAKTKSSKDHVFKNQVVKTTTGRNDVRTPFGRAQCRVRIFGCW